MLDSDICATSDHLSESKPLYEIDLMEQAINALLFEELTAFLESQKTQEEEFYSDNKRNGYYYRIFKSPMGDIHIRVPRDRNGNFHPHILPKKHSFNPKDKDIVFSLFFEKPDKQTALELAEKIYSGYQPEVVTHLSNLLLSTLQNYYQQIES